MAKASDRGERRAAAVRLPKPTPALTEARAAERAAREAGEQRQRRSVMRGLVVLAMLALAASMARAGLDRVFVHGWWRQW